MALNTRNTAVERFVTAGETVVGAVSFLDEGVDAVLDNLQKLGNVNTLFLATFTDARGIAGGWRLRRHPDPKA
jgi:hypothetical protein